MESTVFTTLLLLSLYFCIPMRGLFQDSKGTAFQVPKPCKFGLLSQCIVGGNNPFSSQSQAPQNTESGNSHPGFTFPSFTNLFVASRSSQYNEIRKSETTTDRTIDWSTIHIHISQETRKSASVPYVLSYPCFPQTNTKFTLPAS